MQNILFLMRKNFSKVMSHGGTQGLHYKGVKQFIIISDKNNLAQKRA